VVVLAEVAVSLKKHLSKHEYICEYCGEGDIHKMTFLADAKEVQYLQRLIKNPGAT